jgi:DNA-binding CsgD family transcriptional regulator
LHSSGPLRGRRRERARLENLLDEARGGRSGVLVLRGEPGIGKTALLRYLVEAASNFTVVRCAGIESEMELPFAGLHELCSPLLSGVDALPDAQRRALGVALGLEYGQSPDRLLVALGALGLLSAASEGGPLLCVVEDAHWLDQASAQVLGFVGRRLLAEPIALAFAARAPVTEPDHLMGLPELRLEGLDVASARALLDSVSTTRVDEHLRARIIDETRGNPLALLELGARMGAVGFTGSFARAADEATLSHRIEDEYVARLNALPPDTQVMMLLTAADSVGDRALIERAANRLRLGVDAVDAAEETGLVSVGASIRFRHPLLRSAVYRAASAERRRAVHRALAEVTDPDSDPDRRAWHHAYAVSDHDENVASELIGSADRAQRRGGAAAAAAFLERAVALTPDIAGRSSRALVAAESKYAAGDLAGAHALLAMADSAHLSQLEHAKVDLLRGQISFTQHHGGDAPALLLKAATSLEPLDVELARGAYLQALMATSYAGRFGETKVRLDIGHAALSLPLDPVPTPTQLLVRGMATRMTEGYVAAAPTLKEAVRQYRNGPPDPGYVGYCLNLMAMNLCDDEAWYSMVTGAVGLAREKGMLSWLPFGLDSLAEFFVHAGELARAESLMHEVSRIDPVVTEVTSLQIALLVAAWQGDAVKAEKAMRELTEAATARGEGWLLDLVDFAKAVLDNGLADFAPAGDAAENASRKGDFVPRFTFRSLFELVEASVRLGDSDRARSATEQLTTFATASGTDLALGMAVRSQALLVEGNAADDLHREAIERLSRSKMRVYLARAELSYGEWLRRRNRRVDARIQLRSAHAALTAIGANGFAERARRELQATGEKLRRRTDLTAAELTPQEQQVAHLARERKTNSEIGAELFLSPRTVEWHLRRIFAKLEIGSRRELDAALTRQATMDWQPRTDTG